MQNFMRAALLGAVVIVFGLTAGDRAGHAAVVDFDPSPAISTTGGQLVPNSANFTDGDFYIEAFWAVGTGSGTGAFTSGHFHLGPEAGSSGNVEAQHENGAADLQGLFIRRIDNAPFSLTSTDYRVRADETINGFSPNDVQLLVSTTFNPTGTVASQFTGHSTGGINPAFQTLAFAGFGSVTQIFLSSSSSVSFDNIVLDSALSSVPLPAALPLFLTALSALGLMGWRRRRTA